MPPLIRSKAQVRPQYYVQTGSMYENPWGVPPETIRQMEEDLPDEYVAQVIYGRYVEASGLVFSVNLINRTLVGPGLKVEKWVAPDIDLNYRLRWDYMRTGRQATYIAAADLARKNDYTVIYVFDTTLCPAQPAQMVYFHRLNRVSWDSIYAAIASVSARFGVEVLLDSSGMGGDVVQDELEGRFYCVKCDAAVPYNLSNGTLDCPTCGSRGHRIQVDGLNFSGRNKEQLVTKLQDAMGYGQKWREDWGLLRMPRIEQVAEELTFYRMDDKKLVTDCVMGLGLVAWQLDFEETGGAFGSVHG